MTRETGLLIVVPQAEHVIGAHRLDHDPAASRGVPAHVTLLYPFAPADEVGTLEEGLAELFAGMKPFDSSFSEFARFGDEVLYLAPDNPERYSAMTDAIADRFPSYPPYEGQFDEVIPHLTVADGGGDFAAMQREMEPWMPVRTRVDRVVLIEERDRFWYHRAVFPLGGGW